jgi:hypothetical protein
MATFFHYLPYILGAGFAVLVLYCLFDGGETRKPAHRERPRRAYYRWDSNATHHD